jgi:hypothetical protein
MRAQKTGGVAALLYDRFPEQLPTDRAVEVFVVELP